MTTRTPYRRHTAKFKQQLCRDIRSGVIGRREARRVHRLSDNLIHAWLAAYDAGELVNSSVSNASVHAGCRARIAALERTVEQLKAALARRLRVKCDR